jgi:hypothetical protein
MPTRVVIATLLAALAAPAVAAPPVTVVELFQSQGCSSCPPANANVNALIAARPDVLALSFAVTYWDQLGWKDGFATRANTQRQWDYAKGLHHDNVWTPQVVINGRSDLVGSNAAALTAALKPLPAGAPALALDDGVLGIGRGTAPRGGADVWLIRYDPRTVAVAVKAGENGGKTLDFPDLADRVADQLATDRLTIQGALEAMPLGHKAELIRWRNEATKTLAQVMP